MTDKLNVEHGLITKVAEDFRARMARETDVAGDYLKGPNPLAVIFAIDDDYRDDLARDLDAYAISLHRKLRTRYAEKNLRLPANVADRISSASDDDDLRIAVHAFVVNCMQPFARSGLDLSTKRGKSMLDDLIQSLREGADILQGKGSAAEPLRTWLLHILDFAKAHRSNGGAENRTKGIKPLFTGRQALFAGLVVLLIVIVIAAV